MRHTHAGKFRGVTEEGVIEGYYSILVVSNFMCSEALDSSGVLLS